MSTPSDLATAVQALTEAVRQAASDPADQVRLLAQLAAYAPPAAPAVASGQVGIAGYQPAGSAGLWAATNRATAATFLDAGGVMRLVPANVVRPSFVGGQLAGYVDEPAGTNLIPNTLAAAGTFANANNTIGDATGEVPALYAGATVLRCTCNPGGDTAMLAQNVGTSGNGAGSYCASVWTWLPSSQAALIPPTVNLGLNIESASASTTVHGAIDVTKTDQWQRIHTVGSYTADATGNSVLRAFTAGLPSFHFYACCAQFEQGNLPSSDIPTTGGVGTRAADNLYLTTPAGLDAVSLAVARAATVSAALCRRAALVALCRACAAYQPTSYDDAQGLQAQATGLLDAEILLAADAGDDASYAALRALRTAVARDLGARGADLAPLRDFAFGAMLPAPVLAYRLYRDATRTDELVARVDPAHPAFMPATFRALSF